MSEKPKTTWLKKALGMAPMTGLACSMAVAAPLSPLPDPVLDTPLMQSNGSAPKPQAEIVLAGGCFWGVQAVFQHTKGVVKAISGYAGGKAETAHYEMDNSGTTGHAEAVQVTYDPTQITLGKILKVFFAVAHDPTELNRQGPDRGTQYRSAIFTNAPEQQKVARAYIAQLNQAGIFSQPIVTTIEPLPAFYPAEDYHQNFAKLHPDNPYIIINDLPKIAALEKTFPELYVRQ